MFVKEKFIFTFQKLNTFLTKQALQTVHIIAYTGTAVNNHINCLVNQKQFFKHFTSHHDSLLLLYRRFTAFQSCFTKLVGGYVLIL